MKVVFIGDNGVGKKSLCKKMVYSNYENKNEYEKYCKKIDGIIVEIDCIKKMKNIKKYDLVVLLFDLTQLCSFWGISKWLGKIKTCDSKKKIILVGTKRDRERNITNIQIENLCKNYENIEMKYIEVSAKLGTNISEFEKEIILSKPTNLEIIKEEKKYNTFDSNDGDFEEIEYNDSSIRDSIIKKKGIFRKFVNSLMNCFYGNNIK